MVKVQSNSGRGIMTYLDLNFNCLRLFVVGSHIFKVELAHQV